MRTFPPFRDHGLSVLPLLFSILFLTACSGSSEKDGRKGEEKAREESGPKEGEDGEAVALFFGNSLTAGSGVDQDEAFPALIQERIDSLGWGIEVVNAGVSGETSAGGKGRIDWILERHEPDLFVLELGANDGLRGVDPEETKRNLQAIIDQVEDRYPEARIVLAGMKVPPNMGPEYSKEFQKIFKELAEANGIELIPFLLKGVAGEEDLNQEDGIHPTAEGHRIVARTVWDHIRDDLRALVEEG